MTLMQSFSKEVDGAVDNRVKPIVESINKLKGDVDSRLKTAGKEYLDSLRSQIQSKEITKNDLETLLKDLKAISDIIHNDK